MLYIYTFMVQSMLSYSCIKTYTHIIKYIYTYIHIGFTYHIQLLYAAVTFVSS